MWNDVCKERSKLQKLKKHLHDSWYKMKANAKSVDEHKQQNSAELAQYLKDMQYIKIN